ncbi:MAG: GIY-YIG nuclease family protein [Prolixibacteraceae bacterium]|nr:GIY-YIG nuclease family protein [Prolixibacteraceae bacterium]
MAFTYILHSQQLDKYYIGSTRNSLEERIEKHLSNHDGFTAKAKDWKVVFTESFECYDLAAQKEKTIKGWKSRKMIQKLIESTGH